ISRIKPEMIQEHLEKRKSLTNKKRKGVTNVTINLDLTILKSIFNFARRKGWIEKNPCDQISKRPEEEHQKYVPSIQDFQKVLGAAKGGDKVLLQVCFLTGGRISEVLNLRWEDITKDDVILRSRKHRYGDLRARHIPLSTALKEAFTRLPHNEEHVFPRRTYPRALLIRLCKQAKVRRFTWHCIRHLSATILSNDNTPLLDISQLLGHSDVTTTQIYLRSLGLKAATERLSDILKG
ncbi:MAG TPA: tyrosine-type recombinase/integrase, partial [Thermodesulfobacteriota bacterium]|nr:tyrosine-type recombinase/integrase [Thermodesulfobacteriota bacterium]